MLQTLNTDVLAIILHHIHDQFTLRNVILALRPPSGLSPAQKGMQKYSNNLEVFLLALNVRLSRPIRLSSELFEQSVQLIEALGPHASSIKVLEVVLEYEECSLAGTMWMAPFKRQISGMHFQHALALQVTVRSLFSSTNGLHSLTWLRSPSPSMADMVAMEKLAGLRNMTIDCAYSQGWNDRSNPNAIAHDKYWS